ncbi:MAG TPA: biopolymer transporter ExbD [Steroidobacteraceae bacterium]|jgi:biopolymer transport protein ExbD|nr:biopolymer transporter ExbD [Steroidobacteraceae bacterium]
MAMSVGSSGGGSNPEVMAAINTTPLVDVMLVLLIIFLITIPVINKNVKVDLPKAVNIPTVTKPENITVSVDKEGAIYWADKKITDRNQLLELVKSIAVEKPQPEIHIRADKDARYEAVGKVIFTIQRGGVVKVGFLTEPDHGIRGYR